MKTESDSLGVHAGKYLTIGLGNETYGIAVEHVREIIRVPKITPVPQLPAYLKGVINLRGRVLPVVDLRLKFGLEARFAERTCVVVVHCRKTPATPAIALGLLVDSVEEVLNVAANAIEPPPDLGAGRTAEGLLGMAKVGGQIKTLLAIDRVLFGAGEPGCPKAA